LSLTHLPTMRRRYLAEEAALRRQKEAERERAEAERGRLAVREERVRIARKLRLYPAA
jgi:hypothetical protein